jgi:hypothetical protein
MTSATAPSLEDCSSLDQTTPFFGLAIHQPLPPTLTVRDIPAMRILGLESEDILNVCICIKSDTKERGAGYASIVITATNYRSTGPVPAHRIFGYRWLSLVWGKLDREEHVRCGHATIQCIYTGQSSFNENIQSTRRCGRKVYEGRGTSTSD